MASIKIQKLGKSFGKTKLFSELDLNIEKGEFVVLVGPSGCGKTTLLRSIAGLEEIQSGSIFFDKRDITHVAPKDRHVGMVFQNYALYPHLTVAENLAYPLRILRYTKREREKKIAKVSQLLEIEAFLSKKPAALSGGQKQRVAIGRALVREPDVFLFDEPLSNLDARLRERTREEIAKLHIQLQRTTVYVTHDQQEAMTLADKLVVMKQGKILQIGKPSELYATPSCKFVAHFLGALSCNFLQATYIGNNVIEIETKKIILVSSLNANILQEGAHFWLGIRAEDCTLYTEPSISRLMAKVSLCENLGREWQVQVSIGKAMFWIISEVAFSVGDTVYVALNESKLLLFDYTSEQRIV